MPIQRPILLESPAAWLPTTPYALNAAVTNGPNVYRATVGGNSAAAPATGPAGTGGAIVDNTVTWAWMPTGPTLVTALLVPNGNFWTLVALAPAAHAASHHMGGTDPLALGSIATALTAGRILFPAGGVATSDAGLAWDNTNKRLGVNAPAAPLADFHVGSGALAIAGHVAVRIEPVWTSNGGLGGYDRAFLFHPTFNYTVGTNAIGMQIIPEIGGGFNIPTLFGVAISPNTTGTVGTYYGIYVYPRTGAGVVTNNHDAAFVGGGCVGVNTGSPTAWLHIGAGTATRAPVGLTSGPLLATPVAGRVEFLTDAYYGTITTGAARKTFAFLEAPTFTGTVTLSSGLACRIRAVAGAGAHTLALTDWTLVVNATAAAAVNLPTSASAYNAGTGTGQTFNIKCKGLSAFATTVTANGAELIDGSAVPVSLSAGVNLRIQSDGVGWIIV